MFSVYLSKGRQVIVNIPPLIDILNLIYWLGDFRTFYFFTYNTFLTYFPPLDTRELSLSCLPDEVWYSAKVSIYKLLSFHDDKTGAYYMSSHWLDYASWLKQNSLTIVYPCNKLLKWHYFSIVGVLTGWIRRLWMSFKI